MKPTLPPSPHFPEGKMDIKEKIARIWRDGGSSWNINKKVEKTLALPELDEHYRAKGWKSPSDIQTPEFSRCRRQSAGMTC